MALDMKMKKEKINLAQIFKEDGKMQIDVDDIETNQLELLGFLRCYVKVLEKDIVNEMYEGR